MTSEKELLRLSTAGGVDDGKSTLIGRLLYDSKGIYEDQIASIRKVSTNETAGKIDFALLTDGLRSEREQGITIDVAYRYFSTPKRKFIIADTPGHEQYTRNMATGASTADLAIVLIDARNGVLAQSRRHAYIASLLGIKNLVIAVNKMDLVDFREDVFDGIRAEFTSFAQQLHATPYFIPISALEGDNVVRKSERTPWYSGDSLLEHLEAAPVMASRDLAPMRFPVQYVIRPNLDFRGYAGQVASGIIRPGDAVLVLPSGRTSRIASIAAYEGDLPEAFAPMSVTVVLEDELDIGRGDMLVPPVQPAQVSRRVEAMLVWMNAKPLEANRTYLAKHTTQQVQATVTSIRHRVNINTLAREITDRLELNEIGAVVIETHRPLFFDPYEENRATGAFILIDAVTNATLAAGMITGREITEGEPAATNQEVRFEASRVSPAERFLRTGHLPAIVGVGDSDTAYQLERELFDRGCLVQVLDGGEISTEWVRVAMAAGLILICPGRVEEWRGTVGGDRAVETAGLSVAEVCRSMEARGIIRARPTPLTGGEGI